MAAKVVHFGTDDCNRLLVLRSVDYSVGLCPTVEEFHSVLQKRADAASGYGYSDHCNKCLLSFRARVCSTKAAIFAASLPGERAGDDKIELALTEARRKLIEQAKKLIATL